MSGLSHTLTSAGARLDRRISLESESIHHPTKRLRMGGQPPSLSSESGDGNCHYHPGGDEDAPDSGEGRKWACPWYKLDMEKHNRCRQFTFTRFGDVAQHIFRCHVLPKNPYCAVCEQKFKTETERNAHSQRRTCKQTPGGSITLAKWEELKPPRGKRGDNITKKWYMLFRRLFPKKMEPESACLYDDARDSIVEVRDIARKVMFDDPDFVPGMRLLNRLEAQYLPPRPGVEIGTSEPEHQQPRLQGLAPPPSNLQAADPSPSPSNPVIPNDLDTGYNFDSWADIGEGPVLPLAAFPEEPPASEYDWYWCQHLNLEGTGTVNLEGIGTADAITAPGADEGPAAAQDSFGPFGGSLNI